MSSAYSLPVIVPSGADILAPEPEGAVLGVAEFALERGLVAGESFGVAVGKEHIVLDLSCRKTPDGRYMVVTDRWKNFTTLELNGETLERFSGSCAEFLVHAVDVEGKCSGIDEQLLGILAENSPLKCVYAGGISSWADIDLIGNAGRGMVDYTIGSALDIFGGTLSYEKVVANQH